ncbi:septation ring formation regulator EzrA [Mycoplasma zalophi]|uniref:Septation ring formation regulator EzrA n=1 Tax=Mycoplasma zalophi TaxID=191287 RepID=A0ABS6DRI3_9MOLU|nr:septation ring formation regulator EzrA [Mycoplasma zalophi]MBU4692381.1 septation ring formation regulator EzrA [Mycoplasma zalophi]
MLKNFTQTLTQFEMFSKNDIEFNKIYNQYAQMYTKFKAKHSGLVFYSTTLKNTIHFTFDKKLVVILKEIKNIDKGLRKCKKDIKVISQLEKNINSFVKKHTKNTELIIHHARLLFSFFRKLSSYVKINEQKYVFFNSEIQIIENQWSENYNFFKNNEFIKNNSNINFTNLKNLNLILLNYSKILNEAYGLKMFLDTKINDFFKIKTKLQQNCFTNFIVKFNITKRLSEIEKWIKSLQELFEQKNYLKNSKKINELFANLLQEINKIIHEFKIEENAYKYLKETTYNKENVETLLKNLEEKKQELKKDYLFFKKNNQLTYAMEENILKYKNLWKNDFRDDFFTLISGTKFTNQQALLQLLTIIKEINNQLIVIQDLKKQFSPLNEVISKMKKYEFKFLAMQAELKTLNLELTDIEWKNIENIKEFNKKIRIKNQNNSYIFEAFNDDVEDFVLKVKAMEASIGIKIKAYKLFQISITFFNRYRSSIPDINNLCLEIEKSIESKKYIEAVDKIYKHIEKGSN